MSSENTGNFSWSKLLIGILFIITSLIAFSDPASDLVAIVYVFAFMAIFKGIMGLMDADKTGLTMIVSVLDIIIGIFLFFNIGAGIAALPIVFSLWFIVDSIGMIVSSISIGLSSGVIILSVIMGVIGIIIGFALLFNPISSALTFAYLIGIYFMVWGITYIVDAF